MNKALSGYDKSYYDEHLGNNYHDEEKWLPLFERFADHIVTDFAPKRVLDIGCAFGYMVKYLRERGVEAWGIDTSSYAISQADEGVRPYLRVSSACDPLPEDIPQHYDLVLNIEVLEHLTMEDGEKAIARMCTYADTILFSSTGEDFDELTHINVQQPAYWATRFARYGFFKNLQYDVSYVSNYAMQFERRQPTILDIIFDYEHLLQYQRLHKHDEFRSRIYFDMGSGASEDHVQLLTGCPSEPFHHRINIPQGCRSIRFDPMEGTGCLILNLHLRGDSQLLNVSAHNGLSCGNQFLFSTIDPQLEIPIYEYCHWIEITAEIIPMKQDGWLTLYNEISKQQEHIQSLESANTQIQSSLDEKSRYAANLEGEIQSHLAKLAHLEAQLVQEKQSAAEVLAEWKSQSAHERAHAEEVLAEWKRQSAREQQNATERVAALKEQLAEERQAASEKLSDLEERLTLEKQDAEEHAAQLEMVQSQQQERLEQLQNENNALKYQIQDYSNLVAYERNEAKAVSDAYLCIKNSTCWRITKPVRVCLDLIKKFLRPLKKVFISIRTHGVKMTLKKIKHKLRHEPMPVLPPAPVQYAPSAQTGPLSLITQNPVDPIETVIIDESVKRLNLVTDTIDSHSLLGGVATALIVATEFANRYDYELRIITRNSDVSPTNYYKIIEISGISPACKVSFYSDFERHQKAVDYKLEISKDDIFFATSWWSAKAISETTIRKRFFYIIQEVETFFYNFGGEHLLCSQMMQDDDIDYIVNSKYLYDYFRQYEKHIVEHGCYFEPAFPESLYKKNTFTPKAKYKLFFYARPNNPRNLYSVGVYILNRAVERGILDTNEWEVYCVGQNAPVLEFSNGARSNNLGQLSWTEYAEFLTDIDLGLCLMYTPHPSYPPFDVACSGGVVLTNKMMNKVSFDYCKNVIMADLDEDSFMEAFAESIALAKNMEERKKNYEANTICRSWHDTLKQTIEDMGGKI